MRRAKVGDRIKWKMDKSTNPSLAEMYGQEFESEVVAIDKNKGYFVYAPYGVDSIAFESAEIVEGEKIVVNEAIWAIEHVMRIIGAWGAALAMMEYSWAKGFLIFYLVLLVLRVIIIQLNK